MASELFASLPRVVERLGFRAVAGEQSSTSPDSRTIADQADIRGYL